MRKREPWYVSLRTLSCVTLERKLIYSSVWKRVMTSGVARLGRCRQRKGMQLLNGDGEKNRKTYKYCHLWKHIVRLN